MEIQLNELMLLSFWGNTVQDYLIFAGITLVVYLFFSIIITFTMKRLAKMAKRTQTDLDDLIIKSLRRIKWPIFLIILLATTPVLLEVHEKIGIYAKFAIIIIITYEAIRISSTFIDYVTAKAIQKDGKNLIFKPFGTILKIAFWLVGGVLILGNLGYNVNSLIAGLGIGGIAIALALQNVLGDIFSSLSIYFDKPFKPGDFIALGDKKGTVNSIGIKTTRLTSMDGEELIVPNATLVNSQVQNYGKVKKRRGTFNIGITYETSLAKVKKAKKIIADSVKNCKDAELDRLHFEEFGDSALIFGIVFYAKTGEYSKFMDVKEKINLSIMEGFEKEGIEFAYPTQTLFIKK
ncbi:mechanosensitive ion channel family protein [Patescibacteria group bacterium]|nr:mechanosensitive ion channel family protein [Patescibacteria group bacterium]